MAAKDRESINNGDLTFLPLADQEKNNNNNGQDVESTVKKIRYPYQVYIICGNEIVERFSFYGIRALLIMYMVNILGFSEDRAITVGTTASMLSLFTPILGAMLADSYLGKYRTILYLSIVYGIGDVFQALAATTSLNIPAVAFSMIGLALTALGSGGIKPCIAAFGADQFTLPQQIKEQASFFSTFYLVINLGSFVASIITPILKEDVQCEGQPTCYPLAFGLPAGFMLVSLVIFIVGTPFYTMKDPEGNIVAKVIKTIAHAISRKRKSKEKKKHWLDFANDKYPQNEIEDIKAVFRVSFLYLPLPIFWALYSNSSRWVFQAANMDSRLSATYRFYPEQTGSVNSAMVLVFVPLFDRVIYPFLNKFGILKKSLHKLILGGVLAATAFIISGVLELQLLKNYPIAIGADQSHLNFINMAPMNLQGVLVSNESNQQVTFDLPPNLNYIPDLVSSGEYTLKLKDAHESSYSFTAKDGEASTILISKLDESDQLTFTWPQATYEDSELPARDVVDKPFNGDANLRILQVGVWEDPGESSYNETSEIVSRNLNTSIILSSKYAEQIFEFTRSSDEYSDWRSTPTREVRPFEYKIYVRHEGTDGAVVGVIEVKPGGSYILAVVKNGDTYNYSFTVLTKHNTIHVAWLLPQFFTISVAEILFAVTLIEFSYTQAPISMKSVCQSVWMLSASFGTLIVVIVAESRIFQEQWKEYFLFAGMMLLDIIVFAILSRGYKPLKLFQENETENKSKDKIDEDTNKDK